MPPSTAPARRALSGPAPAIAAALALALALALAPAPARAAEGPPADPAAAKARALLAELKRGDSWAISQRARKLGELGPAAAEAIPALIELAGDRDIFIRHEAIDAIASIGMPDDIRAARRLMSFVGRLRGEKDHKAAARISLLVLPVQRRALEAEPVNAKLWRELGVTYRVLGDAAYAARDSEKALEYLGKALECAEKSLKIDPNDNTATFTLAKTFEAVGRVHWSGDKRKAMAAYRRYYELMLVLVEKVPDFPEGWAEYGKACLKYGDTCFHVGEDYMAAAVYASGEAALKRMPPDDEDLALVRLGLTVSYGLVADDRLQRGDHDGAVEVLKRSLEIAKSITKLHPVAGGRHRLQFVLHARSGLQVAYMLQGKYALALRELEQSRADAAEEGVVAKIAADEVKLLKQLATLDPDAREAKRLLGEALESYADGKSRKGRVGTTVLYDGAVAALAGLPGADTIELRRKQFRARLDCILKDVRNGTIGRARRMCPETVAIGEKLAEELPDDGSFPTGIACVLVAWGGLEKAGGRAAAAGKLHGRAVDILEGLEAKGKLGAHGKILLRGLRTRPGPAAKGKPRE